MLKDDELGCLTGFFFLLCVPVVLLKLGVVLTLTTATARKMSLESKELCYCDYFAIIQSCSHFNVGKECYSWIGLHAVKSNVQAVIEYGNYVHAIETRKLKKSRNTVIKNLIRIWTG